MVEYIGRYLFNDVLKPNRVRCRARGIFRVRVKVRYRCVMKVGTNSQSAHIPIIHL